MDTLRRFFGVLIAIAIATIPAVATAKSRGYTSYFTPVIFASSDGTGQGSLVITPTEGFTGTITITFDRTLVNPPPLFQSMPSAVHVTAPGSPVAISGSKPVATPIRFSWTSWAIGDYEVMAVLTSGALKARVPVEVFVKSSHVFVTSWHHDGFRTGQSPLETTLNTSNVNAATFGKVFEHLTNGEMEAQPLYVPSVYVNGKFHNVVFVATLNDYVYAFDADDVTGANANPLWMTNVGPVAPAGTGGGGDGYNQGAVSTPTINVTLNVMYVVTKNLNNSVASFQIHGLDLSTGHEKLGGPRDIGATISGTIGGVNGKVVFQPTLQYQRVGLLLLNGVVYVGFGGLDGDTAPCRGWIMGFNQTNLQLVSAFTTAPDTGIGSQTAFAGGGIWMSGGGLATDGTYIYATTGNGDFDANNTGGRDYGDSCLKLLPYLNTLKVVDYFTPFNQQDLDSQDLDLGSSSPMLIPPGVTTTPLLLQLSKTSEVYLLNRNSMGKFNASTDQVFQEFSTNANAFHCTAAYYNGAVYFASDDGPLTAYRLTSSGLTTTPFATTSTAFNAASPEISFNDKFANPVASGIVWIVEDNGGNATLHAYRGSDLTELFSNPTGGTFIKFSAPTVAHGRVYVTCGDRLAVFGLK